MSRSDASSRQLLLVATDVSAADAIRAQGRRAGWEVARADDAFAALEQAARNGPVDAVLLDVPSLRPRVAEFSQALATVRPGVPIYMLCPPYLEPQTRRDAAAIGAQYLIEPLDAGDWRAMSVTGNGSPRQATTGVAGEEARVLQDVRGLLGKLELPLEDFLAAAARWASLALGRTPVWIRWASRSAKFPPDAVESPGVVTLPLATRSGSSGELALGDAPPARRAAVEEVGRLLASLMGCREREAVFRRMAFTDYLSGARNRRYLMHSLDRLMVRADREGFQMTLLVFDIDDFKRYNDQRGHAVGDEIICDVVRLMRQCTRPQDIVARIGGDEFAMLLWDAGPPRQPGSRHPQVITAVIERFRRTLAGHTLRSLGPEARGTLTVSGGLATFPADASAPAALLARAMAGLKAAKQSGKDRITLVGPDPGAPASS